MMAAVIVMATQGDGDDGCDGDDGPCHFQERISWGDLENCNAKGLSLKKYQSEPNT